MAVFLGQMDGDKKKADLNIQSSAKENLILRQGLPIGPGFHQRIPGSNAWSLQQDLGTIYIEELRTGPFIIRFSLLRLIKKMTLHFSTESVAICARIATKSNWRFENMNLREGQSVLYNISAEKEKISFEKGKEYQSFEILCAPEKLKSLLSLFPHLPKFTDKVPAILLNKPFFTDTAVLDIVQKMADIPVPKDLQLYYIEKKLEELFFLLLSSASQKNSTKEPVSGTHTLEESEMLYGNPTRKPLGLLGMKTALSNERDLINVIRMGVTKGAMDNLMELTGITSDEMTAIVGISGRTLRRYTAKTLLSREQSERIVELARLYNRGEEVFGNLNNFREWMNSLVMALGNKRPKEFLDTSFGIDMLMNELIKIEHGVFA